MIEHPLVTAEALGKILYKLNFDDEMCANIHNMEKYFTGHKVIIVGSNPGKESPANVAFHPDTKSAKTVSSWFNDEMIYVYFMNIFNVKGDIKTLPKLSAGGITKFKDSFKFHKACGYKIIGCGEYVSKQLNMMQIPHFKMPHPSGCCRFWNDKEAGKAKIEEMLKWVKDGN